MAGVNKFQIWLFKYGGAGALAEKLGVSTEVVNRWRRGEGWPRIMIILEIVKLSKGELTTDDVIECTYPRAKRGNI